MLDLQALQWAEVEGGPKSPLLCDLWYFVNRFTFIKVLASHSVKHIYVLIYSRVSGKGIDQVVQAERVRLLSPMRGSLLQVNTSGSTSSVQVKNNSGLVIGDEVGALKTLTLSLVRQNGLGRQGFLTIIAL